MASDSGKPSALLDQDWKAIYTQMKKASEALNDIQVRHDDLLKAAKEGKPVSANTARKFLTSNVNDIKNVQSCIDGCHESVPVQLRHSCKSVAKARKVLGTAELFEAIALNMHPRDVLSFIYINKAATQIFMDSYKLKDHLCLRTGEGSIFNSPFIVDSSCNGQEEDDFDDEEEPTGEAGAFAGFTLNYHYYVRKDHDPHGNGTSQQHRMGIEAFFAPFKNLPEFGSLVSSMLICTPVITTMQVTIDCCQGCQRARETTPRFSASRCSYSPNSSRQYYHGDESKHLDEASIASNNVLASFEIKNKTGITVGDLRDATEKLRRDHALCPFATVEQHDEDTGEVRPYVRFYGDLTMKNDDPFVVAKIEKKIVSDLAGRNNWTSSDDSRCVLGAYVKFKKTTHDNKWKIPTFAEFKKRYAEWI